MEVINIIEIVFRLNIYLILMMNNKKNWFVIYALCSRNKEIYVNRSSGPDQ